MPALELDDGEVITENTAILPYLGKRFKLWPTDPKAETRALSLIGWFASSVHPAHAHVGRPERYTADQAAYPGIKRGRAQDLPRLSPGDRRGCSPDGNGFGDDYSVLDPYAFVFYTWGVRRELPMGELKNYTAFKDRMVAAPRGAARARRREGEGLASADGAHARLIRAIASRFHSSHGRSSMRSLTAAPARASPGVR